jgi:fructokinase
MTEEMRIGIDIGGTKVAAVILDGKGREQGRCRNEVAPDYSATLESFAAVVAELERQAGAAGRVGISMPGVVNGAGEPQLVANLPWLQGKPFRGDLEQVLARPVAIGNDANCFALSEAVDGAARGAEVVFGVILGTGVGGGIVVRGRVVSGANGTAGEWGHNPLPWRDPSDGAETVCGCGQTGCIETWLNGGALARDYLALSGRAATAEEVSRQAEGGDEAASRAIAQFESRLARALAGAINFLDPDVIVLGGGLSQISRLYENVPKHWPRHASSGAGSTRLVKAAHGPDSGVRGAAWL